MGFPHLAIQQMCTWQIVCSVWEYLNEKSASLSIEANTYLDNLFFCLDYGMCKYRGALGTVHSATWLWV